MLLYSLRLFLNIVKRQLNLLGVHIKPQSAPYIIDIEASGFGTQSYPIEVGVVAPDGSKFCSLITPLPDWLHWSQEAEELHNISHDTLLEFGEDAHQVCTQLNDFCDGQRLYSDGWVVDYPWLIKLYSAVGMRMSFTVSPLELILSESQMDNWQATRQRIWKQTSGARHRASHDAQVIQQVYLATSKPARGLLARLRS